MTTRVRAGLVAGLTAVAVALGSAAYASPGARSDAGQDVDAEQVLDGVVFGRGPVAEALGADDTGRTVGTATERSVDDASDRLLGSILEHEPEAAEAVASDLASGDPYVVEDALAEASGLLDRAIEREYPDLTTSPEMNPQCGVICVCVAAVEIALAGGIAVVLVAETAVGGHFVLWTKTKLWNNSVEPRSLSADAFTADVTTALADR